MTQMSMQMAKQRQQKKLETPIEWELAKFIKATNPGMIQPASRASANLT